MRSGLTTALTKGATSQSPYRLIPISLFDSEGMNVGSTFATTRKASPRFRMTSTSGWNWSP